MIESNGRGVLDTPLEPVIGLAEGETLVAGHDGCPRIRTAAL
jgi:hypothetical protein